jgi:periplasmic protein TonB
MHMFQQAIWFGLSLALHLTVVAGLYFSVSHNCEHTPKSIMVALDNFEAADIPVRTASRVLPMKAALPATPVSMAVLTKPAALSGTLQTSTLQTLKTPGPAEQPGGKEPPVAAPGGQVVSADLSRREDAVPVLSAFSKKTFPQLFSAADELQPPKKIQQQNLKDTFAYIRDLITKQLVYPPIARRMNWSGKAVVTFIITEAGAVHTIRIIESSGYSILDKCALETIQSLAPLPRQPVQVEITVPVNFTLMR